MASPPFAIFATAPFGVVLALELEAGLDEVLVAVLRADVKVVDRVMFELGAAVGRLEFPLVEVETTVTVDEGTDEVEVLE